MNKESTIKLCEGIASCCTRLCSILYKTNSTYDIDKGLLENFGCVLGYICAKGGLSLDEAGSCIACFTGINGGNKEDFYHIAYALQFYCNQLLKLEEKGLNNLLISSSICYNLANPKTWNDFSNNIPFHNVNFLSMIGLWTELSTFLHYYIPQEINPILEKL